MSWVDFTDLGNTTLPVRDTTRATSEKIYFVHVQGYKSSISCRTWKICKRPLFWGQPRGHSHYVGGYRAMWINAIHEFHADTTRLLTSSDHDIIPMAYDPCMFHFCINFYYNRFANCWGANRAHFYKFNDFVAKLSRKIISLGRCIYLYMHWFFTGTILRESTPKMRKDLVLCAHLVPTLPVDTLFSTNIWHWTPPIFVHPVQGYKSSLSCRTWKICKQCHHGEQNTYTGRLTYQPSIRNDMFQK